MGDDESRWNSGFRKHLMNMDLCHNDDNETKFFSMCDGNRRRLKTTVNQTNPMGNKPSSKFQNHPMDIEINGDVMHEMGHKIETLKEKLAQQLQDSQTGEASEMDQIGEDESDQIGEDESDQIGEDESDQIGEDGSDQIGEDESDQIGE